MLQHEFNQRNYDKPSLLVVQQQSQVQDHIKCGEVYTWLCAGELYAVECKLCEDQPLCPLSEFPQHMEIWHSDWETTTQDEEESHDDFYDDHALSCTNNESGLFNLHDQLQNERKTNHEEHEEILEPFEQVLIEQDITIDSTQNSEVVNEEEYFKDANEQVTETAQCQFENKPKQKQKQFFKVSQTLNEQSAADNEITDNERDLQYSAEFKQSDEKLYVYETNGLHKKPKCLKFQIKGKNNENILKKYNRNFKKTLTSIKEKKKNLLETTSDNETSAEEYTTKRKVSRKSNKITRSIKKNLTKIKKIKQTLSKIVKDISDLKEIDETESEASEKQTDDLLKLKTLQTKYSENNNISSNSKRNLKSKCKDLKEFRNTYTGKTKRERNEVEKGTSKFEQQQHKETESVNKNHIKIVVETENSAKIKDYTFNKSARNRKNKNNLKVGAKMNTTTTEVNGSGSVTNESEKIGNKRKIQKHETESNDQESNEFDADNMGGIKVVQKAKSSFKINKNISTKLQKCRKTRRIIRRNVKKRRKIQETKTERSENQTLESAKETETKETNSQIEVSLKINTKENTETGKNGRTMGKNGKESGEIETEFNEIEELSENKPDCGEKATKRSEYKTEQSDNETVQNENGTKFCINKTSKNEKQLIELDDELNENRKTEETADNNKSSLYANKTKPNEIEPFLIETQAEEAEQEKIATEYKTNNIKYMECLQIKTKAENVLKKNRTYRKNAKEKEKYIKVSAEKSENETKVSGNEMDYFTGNVKNKCFENVKLNLRKSLRNLEKKNKHYQNSKHGNESVIALREINKKETLYSKNFKQTLSKTNQRKRIKNRIAAREQKQGEMKLSESEAENTKNLEKARTLEMKNKIKQQAFKSTAIKRNLKRELGEEKLSESSLLNNEKNIPKNVKIISNTLRSPSKGIFTNYETETKFLKRHACLDNIPTGRRLRLNTRKASQTVLNGTRSKSSCEITEEGNVTYNSLEDSSREFPEGAECTSILKDHLSPDKRTTTKIACEISKKENCISNALEDSSKEFSESSECLQDLTPKRTGRKRLYKPTEVEKEDALLNLPIESSTNHKIHMATSADKRDKGILRRNSIQAKEYFNGVAKGCDTDFSQKEQRESNTKQALVTQFFAIKDTKNPEISKSFETLKELEHNLDNSLTSSNAVSPDQLKFQDSSTSVIADSLSPHSPKTEEEHFEFFEPKEKLNKQHISHLIKLYHEHPRLWDQSHPDFCEPQICRKSWQQITDQWNEFCHRKFTIAEVRIRICTLCQRFIQERERLVLEGELDECAKFPYYEQMQFLEKQKSLQKRRELYEQQNEKILEIYQHFPVLWHIRFYKLRQAKERAQAFENISKALKLCGYHLSSIGVQKRIRSLRKCYRLEKIRHLHAQVEQTPFQSEFHHYERMQFLDKHIDPFVCRICGKIFENLQGFREHLEAENHGNILPEESEAEGELDKETREENIAKETLNHKLTATSPQGVVENVEHVLNENEPEHFLFSPISNHIECFSESENSRDILQRFTPFSSTPNHPMDLITNLQLNESENSSAYIEEVSNFPLTTRNERVVDSVHLENHLIEKIMETVTNNDSLSQPGLDQFINAVTCYDTDNCMTEKAFSPHILHTENAFVVEHPDIVTDQTSSVLSPQPNVDMFGADLLYIEDSFVVEHPDIVTGQNLCVLSPEPSLEASAPDILQTEKPLVVEQPDIATDSTIVNDLDQALEVLSPPGAVQEKCSVEELKNQQVAQSDIQELPSPAPLVVKVQCADFSVDLELNPETSETLNPSLNDSGNQFNSSADISTIPLPDHLIHKMIELYRKFPQLWNPNHLDYNSRNLRRQAWCALTTEFNTAVGKQLSWRTLHRKLTDYAKYYKKLITEQEDYEHMQNKWAFYQDFKFIDDVIAVYDELQRSVHHRDNNFKIIAIYKTLPQLWNIKHPDYNKRSTKQRNIELMCNRLQEENNLQLTTDRLKNRLIELRTQYRVAKKQRLKCLKNQQKFSSNDFEFYESLNFLDDHIDPFICDKCKMEFKKLTDYNQHLKREHAQKARLKKDQAVDLLPYEPGMEHICHICGIKFSTRSNLVHHVKRHEGIRNYECSMCPKKFYASHALKVHIRSHTKECPYTCEKCGMSFVSASKLNQHVKRHLNRKDFPCDFCPKAFFTAFEKDRHERRHLNIRDKACPICGKTFVAGSSYYAHLMLHSGTKRFECDKCDMKFAQYAGLYKHKKRHHQG